jgi:adenylate cyclase
VICAGDHSASSAICYITTGAISIDAELPDWLRQGAVIMIGSNSTPLATGTGNATLPTVKGILFADVAGSTRLYDVLGDSAARAAVCSCLAVMAETVSHHGGSVIETIGDEVMAAFEDPSALFDGAVAIQRRIDAMAPIDGPFGEVRLRVRVGFHVGPVIVEDDHVFGQTVNIAARLVGLAKGSQIFTASANSTLFDERQRCDTRELGALDIKGWPDGIEVLEIEWRSTSDSTVIFMPARHAASTCRKLRLTYAGREWLLEGNASLALGRDPKSDVVLLDRCASRTHARIERRRDKWIFVDQSANGTFIAFAGEAQLWLHHEELPLGRPGMLSIGTAGEVGDCVQFAPE